MPGQNDRRLKSVLIWANPVRNTQQLWGKLKRLSPKIQLSRISNGANPCFLILLVIFFTASLVFAQFQQGGEITFTQREIISSSFGGHQSVDLQRLLLLSLSKRIREIPLSFVSETIQQEKRVGLQSFLLDIDEIKIGKVKTKMSFGDNSTSLSDLAASQLRLRGLVLGLSSISWNLLVLNGKIPEWKSRYSFPSFTRNRFVSGLRASFVPYKQWQGATYFFFREDNPGEYPKDLLVLGTEIRLHLLKNFSLFGEYSHSSSPKLKGDAWQTGVAYQNRAFFSSIAYQYFSPYYYPADKILSNQDRKNISLSLRQCWGKLLSISVSGLRLKTNPKGNPVLSVTTQNNAGVEICLEPPSMPTLNGRYWLSDRIYEAPDSILPRTNDSYHKYLTLEKSLIISQRVKRFDFSLNFRRLDSKEENNLSSRQFSDKIETTVGFTLGKGITLTTGGEMGQNYYASSDIVERGEAIKIGFELHPGFPFSCRSQILLGQSKEEKTERKRRRAEWGANGLFYLPGNFILSIGYRINYSEYQKSSYRWQYFNLRLTKRFGFAGNRVEGYVFNDLNQNGKREKGEKGLGNIKIVLDGAGETFTDKDGHYRFSNLRLKETPISLDLTNLSADYNPVSPLRQKIKLGGWTSAKVDFAVSSLGGIKGNIFCDDNENGFFDPGEPGIPGVMIIVQPANISTITNGSGSFRFANLPIGRQTLTIDATTLSGEYELLTPQIGVKVKKGEWITDANFITKIKIRPVKKFTFGEIEEIRLPSPKEERIVLPPLEKKPRVEKPKPPEKKASPEEIQRLYQEGTRAYTSEEYEKALRIWQKILSLDPGNAAAKRNLVRTQSKLEALRKVKK
ncbi:MAG: SdrD B-like domain-containing protein [Candidatus Edwardsbacteria bacterium]